MHTTFVAPVADGPVDIEVEVLRRGWSMSHAGAEVRNQGATHDHPTTAVFGASRRGFEFTDLEPPDGIVPLAEARSFRDPRPPGVEFFPPDPFWAGRLEGRSALGHASWESYTPGRAGTPDAAVRSDGVSRRWPWRPAPPGAW